jgi:hypothetical protein
MSASNYLENAVLNAISGNGALVIADIYLALFASSPTDAGGGSELSAASYQRKVVLFGAAVLGSMTNDGEVLFDQATTDWGTITAFGLYDAVTNGNLLFYGSLDAPKLVEYGDSLRFQVGSLTISLD